MSLPQLQQRLSDHGNRMSVSALGYWRSGERKPEGAKSLAAVADIEDILMVTPGSLVSLINPTKRPGSVPVRQFPDDFGVMAERLDEVAVDLMDESIYAVRELSTHLVAEVGADGLVHRQHVRTRIQAVQSPVSELAWIELPSRPSPVAPVYTAGYGCRLARLESHADDGAFGALFRLDRTVEVGQATIVEFDLQFPDGYPRASECEHITSRRTQEIVLWVRFTPGFLPDWIEEVELVDGLEVRTTRILDGTAVHAERVGFPRGRLSLLWGYDPATIP